MAQKLPAPFSSYYLSDFWSKVILPSHHLMNSVILSAPGMGSRALIKYTLQNLDSLDPDKSILNQVFLELRLRSIEATPQLAIESVFSSVIGFLEDNKSLFSEYPNIVSSIPSARDFGSLVSFIRFLTSDAKCLITWVIMDGHLLFEQAEHRTQAHTVLQELHTIRPDRTSYVILVSKEVALGQLTEIAIPKLQIHSIYWLPLFDESTTQALFERYATEYSTHFDTQLVSKAHKLSQGDGSINKLIAQKTMNDASFAQAFLMTTNTEELYALIGKDSLDTRNYRIFSSLSPQSKLSVLSPNHKTPSAYALESGLIKKGIGGEYRYYSDLFKVFIERKRKLLTDSLVSSSRSARIHDSQLEALRHNLTGQELRICNYLLEHLREVVSRKTIAQLLWEDHAEERYSEWAIDKVISNIRKKLSTFMPQLTIKSVRKTGVMLS